MMSRKVLLFSIAVIFLCSICEPGGKVRGQVFNDKRITIRVSKKPLFTVFMKLINKYDIAIGFEESILDRDHDHYMFETNVPTDDLRAFYSADRDIAPPVPPFNEHLITLDFKDARLELVMDEIVKQMENYDWELRDDVVNIFPKRGRDPKLQKLLELRISNFSIVQGADVGTIQLKIMLSLPEFNAFLERNALEADTTRDGSVFIERRLVESLTFSNLTFKDLLNSITRSKRGGWILRIKEQASKQGKGSIRLFI